MTKKDLEKQIELLVKDDESNQQTIINQRQEIERLNNIIGEATERAINIQKTFGYVLDDLIYLLMQGSDKE